MKMMKSVEVISHEVKETVGKLDQTYSDWVAHKKQGDFLLYDLLEKSLNFHNFLIANEEHQAAFKALCTFNWHKTTSLVTLIAKKIFGPKNKQVYDYVNALNAALKNGIGVNSSIGMAQWLKDNGGISGVTRNGPKASKPNVERQYRIQVGQNASEFGLKPKLGSFKNEKLVKLIEHGSNHVAILAKVDKNTGEFFPLMLSEQISICDELWKIYGEIIMRDPVYEKKKVEYISKIYVNLDLETKKVMAELS